MEYLRQFANLTAYNAAKGIDNWKTPNVSLIKDDMHVEYDPYVEPVAAIGDILYSDKSFSSTYDSSKTPIAVCVAPKSEFSDGKARYMSLVNMSSRDPENGTTAVGGKYSSSPVAMHWGYGESYVSGLPVYRSNSDALLDLNGRSNSDIIISKTTDFSTLTWSGAKGAYPANTACYKFYTEGTVAHEWYLPSAGELQWIYPNLELINSKLDSLGNLAVKLGDSSTYGSYGYNLWTSSQQGQREVWVCNTRNGSLSVLEKATENMNQRTRALLRY
jgi:hypothetical protein